MTATTAHPSLSLCTVRSLGKEKEWSQLNTTAKERDVLLLFLFHGWDAPQKSFAI
jgi:hypothetical protein